MYLTHLSLQNYRNHKKIDLVFDGKTNLVFGPNGAGKTNILEAIHFLSTTKSIRAAYDKEVISHDADFARIEGKVTEGKYETKLEMAISKSPNFANASSKKVKIDGTAKSLNKFAGTMTSVFFSPTDISILTGSPSLRRKYIDSIFYQIDPEYKRALQIYIKAIRQRNKILETIRETGKGRDLLELWDEKAIQNGRVIQNKRDTFFQFVNENIKTYSKIVNGDGDGIRTEYKKNAITKERIQTYKEREIASASTLVGPQRDDFMVFLNEFNTASFGSRGQQRATLLALKLCEMDFIQREKDSRPILLLDDIFSELDEKHRKAIMEIIDQQQTFVSSASKVVLKDFSFSKVIDLS